MAVLPEFFEAAERRTSAAYETRLNIVMALDYGGGDVRRCKERVLGHMIGTHGFESQRLKGTRSHGR